MCTACHVMGNNQSQRVDICPSSFNDRYGVEVDYFSAGLPQSFTSVPWMTCNASYILEKQNVWKKISSELRMSSRLWCGAGYGCLATQPATVPWKLAQSWHKSSTQHPTSHFPESKRCSMCPSLKQEHRRLYIFYIPVLFEIKFGFCALLARCLGFLKSELNFIVRRLNTNGEHSRLYNNLITLKGISLCLNAQVHRCSVCVDL